ncbi:ROK family protein [Botryobacter ruber]|uniref:ROK family protein n=1 Tax=Botryobacter ruber TaxID=2171629 RepID=UPI000E09FB19|nr:ROK family protein [Botryobacter ruber]
MHCIGIDLGGTRIKIGLTAGEELLDTRVIAAQSIKGLEPHLPLIDEAIADLVQQHDVRALEGVAMAFPGIVNPYAGKVLSTNQKYDDAAQLNLAAYYRERWSADFFIDNDARMASVGEWKYGAGRAYDDLVMVTIGTGIGTSVIMNGQLMRSKHFQAGCLGGHFVVNYKGRQCTCGNIGCAEAEAATWNLAARAAEHANYSDSLLQGQRIDYQALFQASANGDLVATELKEESLDIWAAAIITYIHAYDPEVIILGGGILNSAREILPYLQEKVHQYAWTPWGKVGFKVTELQDAAGIMGAVYSYRNKI